MEVASSVILAAGLSGCGGGQDDDEVEAGASAIRKAVAPPIRSNLLSAGNRADLRSAQTGLRTPTAAELMDWAERQFPAYFDRHEADRYASDLVYRFYPATGNYLGVLGNDVLVLGPATQGQVVNVGTLQSFAAAVGLPAQTVLTDAQASRFLQHATFGTTDADLSAVKAQGVEAWLSGQMALPRGQRAWDWMVANGYAAIDGRALYNSGGPTAEVVLAKEAATSTDPVRQRVALALSEYFVVSALVAQMPWTGMGMAHYWDQLQDHAFGNFRDLLEAMTLNPAMGAWLNMRGNLKEDAAIGRVPDENYAREVMQLFTIGLVQLNADGTPRLGSDGKPLPTYTQDDVTQLARVFTGWDWWDDGRRFPITGTGRDMVYPEYTRRAMVFDADKHSTRQAVVMGTVVPAGSDGPARLGAALDLLFRHPNVGPFFARQMIQRLVTSNPSPAYVARVAAAFADNGAGVRGDLKVVWKAILLDEEARSAASLASTTHGKLREPLLRVLQWLRTFGVQPRSGTWGLWPQDFGNPLYWYGQRAFTPPSVFNWFRPGYVPPGTAMAAAGATAPEFQIVNESTVAQWANAIDNLNLGAIGPAQAWSDWQANVDAEIALAHDATALVWRLNLLLAAGQISEANVQRIAEILTLGATVTAASDANTRRWRVVAAVTLVMCCAEYLVQK